MSASETREHRHARLNLEELIKENPDVDAAQLREAQRLLAELRREGLSGPEYEIASPRERRPFRQRSHTSRR